jgi:hypothetical protein
VRLNNRHVSVCCKLLSVPDTRVYRNVKKTKINLVFIYTYTSSYPHAPLWSVTGPLYLYIYIYILIKTEKDKMISLHTMEALGGDEV